MTFTDELRQLLRTAPQLCLNSTNVENCPYGDFMFNCQNCYICFDTGGSSNGMYMDHSMKTISCMDCSFARHSELCYECLNIAHCYSCEYCVDCTNCNELKHCFDCAGSNNCFGCVGLRHKEYCIYNEQVTKEEYAQRIKEPFDQARFAALVNGYPHLNLHLVNSEDCVGDYVHSGKNCYECFDINNMENCMYYSDGNYNSPDKDCMDIDSGSGNELCYECFSMGYSYNCNFCVHCSSCANCEFSWNLNNCKNCFGCAYLKDKEYYILNKPYSKEEYFEKVAALKAEMLTRNEYTFDTMLAL